MLLAETQAPLTVTSGTGSYTIGATGTWVTASKPTAIYGGFVRDSDGNDSPLEFLTRDRWDAIPDKDANGPPRYALYDPGLTQQATPLGTVYLYPEPDDAYTAYLNLQLALTQFAALTTTFTMPDSYEELIVYNLALRLWREYHNDEPVPQDIVFIAKDSMKVVETANSRIPRASCDLPGGAGGGYSIYSDE